MEPALRAVLEYGLAVVALVAVALFAWYLVRDVIKSRDRALDIADRSIGQTEKLTEAVNRLADRVERDADRRR